MKINCESCIWFDACREKEKDNCLYYYPADQNLIDEIIGKEYEDDLRERHAFYTDQINEQNG